MLRPTNPADNLDNSQLGQLVTKKLQNENPARMTMLSTGGGLLLLFLLCSKVNKLTTVDFVARLFEPVVVMQLVAILFEKKCCQAEESSCPAGCFCATKRGDHLPPDLVCQNKKTASVVTASFGIRTD